MLFKCFGLFDFKSSGEEEDEIDSFEKDTGIWVTSIEEEDGWWRGKLNVAETGNGLLFPKNRVYQVIEFENVQYMLTVSIKAKEERASRIWKAL